MALSTNDITTSTCTLVNGTKELTVTAGQKVAVQVAGVDDTDLVYTVPTGKTLTISISMQGKQISV